MLVRFYLKLGLPSKRFPCQTNTNIKKFISQFWQRNILWLKSIKCTIAHVRNLWNINYNQCIRKMMVRAMMQTMSVNFGCALFIVRFQYSACIQHVRSTNDFAIFSSFGFRALRWNVQGYRKMCNICITLLFVICMIYGGVLKKYEFLSIELQWARQQ